MGLNYKLHASKEKPLHIYTNDFDNNGIEDIVLAKYYNNKQVPVRGKQCTSQQMPFLNDKIKSYSEFANSDLKAVFGDGIDSSLHYEANEFRSGIFINENGKGFNFLPFQIEAQTSIINSIVYEDFDHDGLKDLLMAGNNYCAEVETTRADAGIGVFLKGQNDGKFQFIPNIKTGMFINNDIRNLKSIKTSDGVKILNINNNDKHRLFNINN